MHSQKTNVAVWVDTYQVMRRQGKTKLQAFYWTFACWYWL